MHYGPVRIRNNELDNISIRAVFAVFYDSSTKTRANGRFWKSSVTLLSRKKRCLPMRSN